MKKLPNSIVQHLTNKNAVDAFLELTNLMGFSPEDASKILGVKTFKDLDFKPHGVVPNAVQAVEKFHSVVDDGWISIVGGGQGLYGDGVDTFEVWATDLPDPLPRLSKEDVTLEMLKLQKTKYEL